MNRRKETTVNTEEKREYLIKKIAAELEKSPVEIYISSPRLASARKGSETAQPVSASNPAAHPAPEPEAFPEPDSRRPSYEKHEAELPRHASEVTEIQGDEDAQENPKQLARKQKKEEKEALKQQKKYEKAYRKMQKDITKRGFDTAVLTRLNDPADIYHMSDDEIKEIEIAGVINSDGYYNFIYPKDHDSAKQHKTSRKIIFLTAGFILAVVVLLIVLINNIFSLF